MSVIGLDMGTGRVKAARPDKTGNPQLVRFNGEDSLRSVVFFDPGGRIVVGNEAENLLLVDVKRGVRDWKRFIGTDDVLYLDERGKEYRAKDIATILVEEVKKAFLTETGSVLSKCVCSCPANFNDQQKTELREAVESTGVEVLRIVHEPSASLIGNEVHRRGDGRYLTIDCGHGTTDCSLGQTAGNSIDILNTTGIPKCGGTDFTARLVEYINGEFGRKHGFKIDPSSHAVFYQELYQRAVAAKHGLASRESVTVVCCADGKVLSLEITREKFAELTADLVKQIVDCAEQNLKEGNLTPDDIRAFVPVGGGILVPAIAEEVERRFEKPFTVHSDVHYCVAKGAMLMARLELESRGEDFVAEGGRKLPPSSDVIRDTTAHPLGVAVVDYEESGILQNSVILAKGRPMPSTKVEKFQLSEDGQTCALIEILQGEQGASRDDCLVLGHFELTNLQAVQGKPHPVEIKFSINADGILSASAFDPLDGSSADMTVDYKIEETE